jgi:diguanylate cyclase (GGDEF)-like protein
MKLNIGEARLRLSQPGSRAPLLTAAFLAACPLLHLLGIILFPQDSRLISFLFLIGAPALAATFCLLRARHSPQRLGWIALGAGMAMWAAGMAATMASNVAGISEDGMVGLLLFVLYGVPIIFITASPSSDSGLVRLVDAALAALLGAMFFLHTTTFVQMADNSADAALNKLRLMFDIENAFIAIFCTVRWRAAREAAEQTLFWAMSICSIFYMVLAAVFNHFFPHLAYGGLLDPIITLPFLLLAMFALLARDRAETLGGIRASDGFARVVAVGSPIMLPTALLAVSAVIIPYHPVLGVAGFALSLFGYALRTILVQVRGNDERAALTALALTDALTGVANRRRFDEALETEWSRGRRHGSPLALLMIDIDNFKMLNDAFGHSAGDRCLRDIGRTLAGCVMRKTDIVARYGGEEFAVILPNTGRDDAIHVANWMCRKIAQRAIASPCKSNIVTVSIGVGWTERPDGDDPTILTDAADQALYEAKRAGKNRAIAGFPCEPYIERVSSSA